MQLSCKSPPVRKIHQDGLDNDDDDGDHDDDDDDGDDDDRQATMKTARNKHRPHERLEANLEVEACLCASPLRCT